MEIKYTAHLQWRLHIRSIPYELPRQILQASNEHYKDTLTHHRIAIQRVKYGGGLKEGLWLKIPVKKEGMRYSLGSN